jgi:hypothetical protein
MSGAAVDARQTQGMTPRELAEVHRRNGWVVKPEMQEIVELPKARENARMTP